MSVEQNKAVVREYVEAFSRGDWDRLRGLFTADAVVQGVLGWGGLEVVFPIWQDLHGSFGIHLTLESLAAEDDIVAARFTERGTFTQPFRGSEATGKSYEVVAMEWFEFRDGRIARRWGARDSASISRQLGIKPG